MGNLTKKNKKCQMPGDQPGGAMGTLGFDSYITLTRLFLSSKNKKKDVNEPLIKLLLSNIVKICKRNSDPPGIVRVKTLTLVLTLKYLSLFHKCKPDVADSER